ncbi:hypothetical protein FACS189485_06570 [Spirochaetia bacterium]|nr:hypothetical protein FACS189485_06570 [Spirochaetia bacterium]
MPIIEANHLHNKENLLHISGNHPGWYRWWAKEDAVKKLLDSKQLSKRYFDNLFPHLTKGAGDLKNHYYLYTGIAVKESIRARLDWHINQEHTLSAVKSGFLSTLRQSISSLVSGDQRNENDTNLFIDTLTVEYYSDTNQINTKEANIFLRENEDKEMRLNILVLNIMGNKRSEIHDFLKDLKQARSRAKKRYLEDMQ